MKTMTCNQLGGACDQEFTAETFEEMVEKSKEHGMEMVANGDEAHAEAMKKAMEGMKEPEKMQEWVAGVKALFDSLPEA